MTLHVDRKFFLCLTVALFTIATVPAALAETNPSASLDKHARKIEKHLAKLRTGSYIQLDFRDRAESVGSLGALSQTTFQFTDADNNRVETYSYSDVSGVRQGKAYIGEGSEYGHHFRIRLPVLIVTGAVAAGAATYLAVR
jgi:hypothetical protein